MLVRNLLIVALLCPSGLLFAQGTDKPPPGNPPEILIAAQIDKAGNLVLAEFRTIFIQPASPTSGGGPLYNSRSEAIVPLKGVKIYGKSGKEVTLDAARLQIGSKDTAVLATPYGREVPAFYRTVFKDDILLFAFPEDSPIWKTIDAPELPVRN